MHMCQSENDIGSTQGSYKDIKIYFYGTEMDG